MNRITGMRVQLLIGTMLLIGAVLVLSYFTVYTYTLRVLQERSETETVETFKQFEYSIQSFREETEALIRRLITDERVLRIVERGALPQNIHYEALNDLSAAINEMIQENPYMHSVYFFKEYGEIYGIHEKRNYYTVDERLEHPFYGSAIERGVKAAFPKTWWSGGIQSALFEDYFYSLLPDTELLSIARRVRNERQIQPQTTMIVNIREEALSAMFSRFSNQGDAEVFITDEQGMVISSANPDKLRQSVQYFDRVARGDDYGSFPYREGKTEVQAVYYKLGGTEWTLIRQIPQEVFHRDIRNLRFLMAALLAVSLLFALVLTHLWIRRMLKPMRALMLGMKKTGQGIFHQIPVHPSNHEIDILTTHFNRMSQNLEAVIQQNQKIEAEKRLLEIDALQSQINPHFLYNSLNTIKWMATVAKANHIASALTSLGQVLSPIFRVHSVFHELSDEARILEHYIHMMNYRFGETMTMEWMVDEQDWSRRVPRFLLQPLVENAIEHGFKHRNSEARIRVTTERSSGFFIIRVEDNGQGIPKERLGEVMSSLEMTGFREQERGIGLYNVHRRVQLHYGSHYGLQLYSTPGGGTTVQIKLPDVPD